MRKQRGLSVDELGALVNYSGGAISMIECMWRSPTHQLAVKLDEVFGLPGTFQRLEARIRGIPFTRGFRPFKDAEAEATSLRMFHHTLLSGLFQTEDYARLPNVTIQLIPADWSHPGLMGAFVIAETAELPAIVYFDSALDGTVVQDLDTAEAMTATFDALRTEARTGSASLQLIEEKARWWREQITP